MAEIVVKLVNGELAGRTAQELAKNISACTQEAKKAQIGTQAWIDANNKLADAKALQEDYQNQLKSTAAASDNLKKSFGGILNQIPGFSQLSGAMQGAQGSVGGLTSGFGLLRGAIAATGIGLLVIAVSTLVMWFSKTETGGNVLAGVFRAVGQVVNLLFGKIMDFGKSLWEAINNPKQLLNDLVQFLEDQVINRFKAFGVAFDAINKIIHGDFKNGLKQLTDAAGMWSLGVANITDKMTKLGKEVAAAAVEGYNFVQVMDDIEDRQAQMEITAKENENLVNQLLLQAKNVGKTFEDRLALLDKADAITRKSYQDQLSLSKEYVDAVNKEVAAELTKQGLAVTADNYTAEQRDKIKDATLAYLNLKGQEIDLEEKIANRREQILGKQEKADEKAAAARQKQLDDELKASENIVALKAENQEKGLQQEIDSINSDTQKKIDALVGSQSQIDEQRELLEDIAQRKIQEIKDKYAKDAAKKQLDDANKANDLELVTEQNALTERFLARQISYQQYLDGSEKAVKDSEQRKLKIIENSLGRESKEYQDQYKKILDQEAKFSEAHLKNVLQATQAQANILGNIFGQLGALQQEGTEEQKGFLIAQATMQMIAGAVGAYMQAQEAFPPPVSYVIGAIAAATAVATGLAQINKIKSTQVPKAQTTQKQFATGGYTGEGGVYEPAGIVHRGEIVWSQEDVARFGGIAAVESIRPTSLANFAVGGPVNPYVDNSRPSVSSHNAPPSPVAPIIDYERLAAELNRHVENKIMKIEVHQNLQDTKKGLDTLSTIQNLANV